MKKLKQITALIGVIALAGLYVSTLVLALIGTEQCINLLKAAVYATIVLPVLLWAYSFIYRLIRKDEIFSQAPGAWYHPAWCEAPSHRWREAG